MFSGPPLVAWHLAEFHTDRRALGSFPEVATLHFCWEGLIHAEDSETRCSSLWAVSPPLQCEATTSLFCHWRVPGLKGSLICANIEDHVEALPGECWNPQGAVCVTYDMCYWNGLSLPSPINLPFTNRNWSQQRARKAWEEELCFSYLCFL